MSQPRGPETERERWERKWTLLVGRELPPADWLVTNRTLIGATGRALDWAGGDGRNAIWLAKSGFEVTLADISATALEMARVRANQQGVTLQLQEIDLARELPRSGRYDLLLCHHYFDPELPRRAPEVVVPGGRLVILHPTRKNLERFEKPPRRFLYEEGRLLELVEEQGFAWEIEFYEESWGKDGRHEARLVAQLRELAPNQGVDSPVNRDC